MIEVCELRQTGLFLITPKRFGDAGGWFSETWNARSLAEHGLKPPKFVQDNHSYSSPRQTLRRLHYQSPPHAQAKLVRCLRGAILVFAT